MANLIKHPTTARLTVGDLARIREWGLLAREQTGGEVPGWSDEDKKLLVYLEDTLLEANEENESLTHD